MHGRRNRKVKDSPVFLHEKQEEIRMNMILEDLMKRCPALEVCREDIQAAYEVICESYAQGGKLMACGNGGSCSDAEHIVGELVKGFLRKRPLSDAEKACFDGADAEYLTKALQGGLPALSLNLPALGTAAINDLGGDMNYAQAAWGLARKGDVVVGISTSGNARNVSLAVQAAKARGAKTIGLTGMGGGKLGEICDVCIRVPQKETFLVQEYHLMVYHALCAMVEANFFAE